MRAFVRDAGEFLKIGTVGRETVEMQRLVSLWGCRLVCVCVGVVGYLQSNLLGMITRLGGRAWGGAFDAALTKAGRQQWLGRKGERRFGSDKAQYAGARLTALGRCFQVEERSAMSR